MKISYECLLYMRESALWAIEMWSAMGVASEAMRYYKILNRIENAMLNYKGV